ncbi:hypothetical protein [Pandoraea sp. NPDC090278]|uniref:hypothetical protein n=1 Tax=Pandoraea sp. NPDC090278 TaxID=3364391 RepID=UPI00383BEFA0
MGLYRALQRGQIHVDEVQPTKRGDSALGERRVVKIVEEGEIFNYSGKPGKWMVPVDDDETSTEIPGSPGTAQGESGGRRVKKSTSTDTPGDQGVGESL